MEPRIQTARGVLRSWTLDDLADFHAIWGDPDVIWWGHDPDVGASRERLLRVLSERDQAGTGWFAVEIEAGEVAGNVMVKRADSVPGEVEIGWHFARAYQGQGFATEAAVALLDWAFATGDHQEIIAPIVPDNAPSQRVAAKLGMRPAERITYAGYPHDVWRVGRTQRGRP